MRRTILLCLLVTGCTPAFKIDAPVGEEKILEKPVAGINRLRVRRVLVENPASLKAMVENRRSYRLDFFRQSKDPYFGKERWSTTCIDRNPTGGIEETGDGIFYRSKATAEVGLNTEVCLQNSVDVVQLVGECRKQKIFFEVVASGPKASTMKFRCPDEITF